MKRILAATDFSARSHRAVRRAGMLAHQSGAELILLHAVDEDQPQHLVDLEMTEGRKILEETIASDALPSGVRSHPVIATGAAHDAIIRTAATMSADLIVMGTYRRQLLRDIIVGTTIERVIRTGTWPVLMANNETRPYANVMAAVDQSAASAYAVRAAVTLGLLQNARVTVVHAFDAIAKSKLYLADVPKDHIEAYVEEERKRSVAELEDFMTSLSVPAKSWAPYVVEGEAMPVILQAVETVRPELLVVGTHGRSGVAKVLLGSVAEQVLRTIRIDILAVPTSPPHA